MLELNVPYSEKDLAKEMGAKWNPKDKVWMAPGNSYIDYLPFKKWIDDSIIISKELYIVEAKRRCWKCGSTTRVICIALKDYFNIEEKEEINNQWLITSFLTKIPEEIFIYISQNFNFKMTYSYQLGEKYFANCCDKCNALQGNNYLFHEPFESPFYVNSIESASNLIFHRVALKDDFSADLGEILPIVIGYNSVDEKTQYELISNNSIFDEIKV